MSLVLQKIHQIALREKISFLRKKRGFSYELPEEVERISLDDLRSITDRFERELSEIRSGLENKNAGGPLSEEHAERFYPDTLPSNHSSWVFGGPTTSTAKRISKDSLALQALEDEEFAKEYGRALATAAMQRQAALKLVPR